MDRTACTESQCLYNGALYLYLYLYSPYGPYGLYRASVPVQRCTLPLLCLFCIWQWVIQSLSRSPTSKSIVIFCLTWRCDKCNPRNYLFITAIIRRYRSLAPYTGYRGSDESGEAFADFLFRFFLWAASILACFSFFLCVEVAATYFHSCIRSHHEADKLIK